MPIKLLENDRTNKIILYIVLIALIATATILISMVVMSFASLEETGGG